MLTLFANPGQRVLAAIQNLDAHGSRTDGYSFPQVDFVIKPDGSYMSGFPVSMNLVTAGLFTYPITIPNGITAVGTYVVSISWPDITTSYLQYECYLINVALPFGNSSVSPA